MANFGELVLVLGDLHIPNRESIIPEQFKRMLVPNKMQHVICTGNLGCRDQYDELRNLAPNVHVVNGDFEYNNQIMTGSSSGNGTSEFGSGNGSAGDQMAFPETKIVQVGEFRIGVIHGHQVIPWGDHSCLAMIRRKLDVDILISGHTHQNEVIEHDGCYHINPGSITGAWSSVTKDVCPSFILLAVQGAKVVCYVYELSDGEVNVSKTEFMKGSQPM